MYFLYPREELEGFPLLRYSGYYCCAISSFRISTGLELGAQNLDHKILLAFGTRMNGGRLYSIAG